MLGPISQSVHVFTSRLHHTATIYEIAGIVGLYASQSISHLLTGAPGRVVDLTSTVDLNAIPQDDYVMRLRQSIGDEKGIFYTDANGLLVGENKRKSLSVALPSASSSKGAPWRSCDAELLSDAISSHSAK